MRVRAGSRKHSHQRRLTRDEALESASRVYLQSRETFEQCRVLLEYPLDRRHRRREAAPAFGVDLVVEHFLGRELRVHIDIAKLDSAAAAGLLLLLGACGSLC